MNLSNLNEYRKSRLEDYLNEYYNIPYKMMEDMTKHQLINLGRNLDIRQIKNNIKMRREGMEYRRIIKFAIEQKTEINAICNGCGKIFEDGTINGLKAEHKLILHQPFCKHKQEKFLINT